MCDTTVQNVDSSCSFNPHLFLPLPPATSIALFLSISQPLEQTIKLSNRTESWEYMSVYPIPDASGKWQEVSEYTYQYKMPIEWANRISSPQLNSHLSSYLPPTSLFLNHVSSIYMSLFNDIPYTNAPPPPTLEGKWYCPIIVSTIVCEHDMLKCLSREGEGVWTLFQTIMCICTRRPQNIHIVSQ